MKKNRNFKIRRWQKHETKFLQIQYWDQCFQTIVHFQLYEATARNPYTQFVNCLDTPSIYLLKLALFHSWLIVIL